MTLDTPPEPLPAAVSGQDELHQKPLQTVASDGGSVSGSEAAPESEAASQRGQPQQTPPTPLGSNDKPQPKLSRKQAKKATAAAAAAAAAAKQQPASGSRAQLESPAPSTGATPASSQPGAEAALPAKASPSSEAHAQGGPALDTKPPPDNSHTFAWPVDLVQRYRDLLKAGQAAASSRSSSHAPATYDQPKTSAPTHASFPPHDGPPLPPQLASMCHPISVEELAQMDLDREQRKLDGIPEPDGPRLHLDASLQQVLKAGGSLTGIPLTLRPAGPNFRMAAPTAPEQTTLPAFRSPSGKPAPAGPQHQASHAPGKEAFDAKPHAGSASEVTVEGAGQKQGTFASSASAPALEQAKTSPMRAARERVQAGLASGMAAFGKPLLRNHPQHKQPAQALPVPAGPRAPEGTMPGNAARQQQSGVVLPVPARSQAPEGAVPGAGPQQRQPEDVFPASARSQPPEGAVSGSGAQQRQPGGVASAPAKLQAPEGAVSGSGAQQRQPGSVAPAPASSQAPEGPVPGEGAQQKQSRKVLTVPRPRTGQQLPRQDPTREPARPVTKQQRMDQWLMPKAALHHPVRFRLSSCFLLPSWCLSGDSWCFWISMDHCEGLGRADSSSWLAHVLSSLLHPPSHPSFPRPSPFLYQGR